MEELSGIDSKILVALITSIISLVIALLNSFWQYSNTRKLTRLNYEYSQRIEFLKSDLSTQRMNFIIKNWMVRLRHYINHQKQFNY